jgi:hypothetical protein
MVVGMLCANGTAASTGGDRGRPGDHYVNETRARPGVVCIYGSDRPWASLRRVRIHPPALFAVDRREGIERQRVGWKYVVLTGPTTSGMTIRFRSKLVTGLATDRRQADFDDAFWRARGTSYVVRVRLKAVWFRTGAVSARATLNPRFYGYRPHDVVRSACSV